MGPMSRASSPLARCVRIAAAVCTAASCGGQALEPAPSSSEAGTGSDAAPPDAMAPGWSQQLGVYRDCSYSDVGVATGMGGTITLTQSSAGKLTLTYGDAEAGARVTFSLSFDPTTGTSATLDPPNQSIPWELFCWSGPPITDSGLPIDPAPTSVMLRLTAAALTYDAETVYLSVVGRPETDATCEGRAAGTITCSRE